MKKIYTLILGLLVLLSLTASTAAAPPVSLPDSAISNIVTGGGFYIEDESGAKITLSFTALKTGDDVTGRMQAVANLEEIGLVTMNADVKYLYVDEEEDYLYLCCDNVKARINGISETNDGNIYLAFDNYSDRENVVVYLGPADNEDDDDPYIYYPFTGTIMVR